MNEKQGVIVNAAMALMCLLGMAGEAQGAWQGATSMQTRRAYPTATLLASGKVLVVGGFNVDQGFGASLASAEVYDPVAGSWASAGTLSLARYYQSATRLASGKVLVTGGWNDSTRTAISELYDPATNAWTTVAPLQTARAYHTATLLNSGLVLVAGGIPPSGTAVPPERFDPATQLWTSAGTPVVYRYSHTATLLPTGNVLMLGGVDRASFTETDTSERYDPATNAWTAVAPSGQTREQHTATLLPSGLVLVVGGLASYDAASALTSVQIYDPVANTWRGAASLATARYEHTATLLASGRVMVAGGFDSAGNALNSTELYDPATNVWVNPGTLISATAEHASTALAANNKMLVLAGSSTAVNVMNLAQLYTEPAAATVSATALPATLTYGQTLNMTISVTGATPTGFVAMKEGEASICATKALSAATASCSNATLEPGTHSLRAAYSGDANNTSALSGVLSVQVNKVAAAVTLQSTTNPSVFGQSVTFTASVTGAAPSGSVNILDGAQVVCAAVPLVSGIAACSVSTLPVGNRSMTAVYGGDAHNSGKTSVVLVQQVNAASTTTQVQSSANPSTYTQSVTFTATVLGAASPTGSVNFLDGATPLCSAALSGTTATCTTAALDVGSHTLLANYSGDAGHSASTAQLSQSVTAAATATQLQSSVNPAPFGTSVSFTATVTGVGSPTGTVNFSDGATPLCSATLNAGAAVCTPAALDVGSHTIHADYAGDTRNTASSSQLGQVVNPIATSTQLQSSVNPSSVNQTVTFTATVTGTAAPSGTVDFTDGSTPLCSAAVNAGAAICATAALDAGSHTIHAHYSGDSRNTASTAQLDQTVELLLTTTQLQSSANPSLHGDSVTFTATVSGGATPTGSVAFLDGVAPLCTATLDNGSASCATTTLVAGSHTVHANYGGDAQHAASTAQLDQTVDRVATQIALLSLCRTQFVAGQTFTFNAVLEPAPVSGTVDFLADAVTLCAGVSVAAGSASCSSTALPVQESVALSAHYSGDAHYAPSAVASPIVVRVLSAADVVFRADLEPVVAGCPTR